MIAISKPLFERTMNKRQEQTSCRKIIFSSIISVYELSESPSLACLMMLCYNMNYSDSKAEVCI